MGCALVRWSGCPCKTLAGKRRGCGYADRKLKPNHSFHWYAPWGRSHQVSEARSAENRVPTGFLKEPRSVPPIFGYQSAELCHPRSLERGWDRGEGTAW